jgi:hypothetical protein
MTILNRELWALLCIWKHSWWNWNVRFWNSRFVLFVNKFMARVLNVASVPLITMQCVLQGQGIAWRWVALAPLLSKEKNNKLFFIWENSFTVYFELLLSFSIGRGCIISLSLSLVKPLVIKLSPSKSQLHCLEKNGRQTTKMISYCAYHRYRVLIFYD